MCDRKKMWQKNKKEPILDPYSGSKLPYSHHIFFYTIRFHSHIDNVSGWVCNSYYHLYYFWDLIHILTILLSVLHIVLRDAPSSCSTTSLCMLWTAMAKSIANVRFWLSLHWDWSLLGDSVHFRSSLARIPIKFDNFWVLFGLPGFKFELQPWRRT